MRSDIKTSGDGTPSMYPFDQPCEPGRYPCRVGVAKEGKSGKGTPQLDLTCNIDGRPGPVALHFYVQSTGGMAHTFGQAVHALLPPAEVAAFVRGEPVELVGDELVGRYCWAVVGVEKVKDRDTQEPTGETQPRITKLEPLVPGEAVCSTTAPPTTTPPAGKPAAKAAPKAEDPTGEW